LLPAFFIVQGLTGAQGPPSGRVALSSFSNDATLVYGSQADWDRKEGTLQFVLLRSAQNGSRYGLSMMLLNSFEPQSSRNPTIFGRAGFALATTYFLKGEGNAAPMLVANVTLANISQNNPGQGQINVLTVIFSLTVTLFPTEPSTKLTLVGLAGSLTLSTQNLAISSSDYKDATWDQATGTLVLSVQTKITAGAEHYFSFQLLNPRRDQEAVKVSIECSGLFFSQAMTPGLQNNAPLRVLGIILAKIVQSNPSASALNTLTVTLRGTSKIDAEVLGIKTVFVIEGLKGSGTRDTLQLPLTDVSGIFGSSCVWLQAAGAVLLTMQRDAPFGQEMIFSFRLDNPSVPQFGPDVTIYTSHGSISKFSMVSGKGLAKAFLVAGFTYSMAMQSTPSQAASNKLTFVFACNFDVNASLSPIITVNGLTGSVTNLTGNMYLMLTGNNASLFGNKAFWRNNDKIEFTVNENIPTNAMLSVSFSLINPSEGQASPYIRIRVTGFGVEVFEHAAASPFLTPWQTVSKPPGNSAPLLTGYFVFASMGQSTTLPGYNNTITVTIATNCDFAKTSILQITGMNNATFTTTSVKLLDKFNGFVSLTSGNAFVHYGSANARLFNVELTGTNKLIGGVLYAFKFSFQNPNQLQEPPDLYVSFRGDIIIGNTRVHQPAGLDAVLRVFSHSTPTFRGSKTRWSLQNGAPVIAPRRGFGAVFLPGMGIGPPSANSLFGFQGEWQAEGKVIITIQPGQIMRRGSEQVFSMTVDNPNSACGPASTYMLAFGTFPIYDELLQGETRKLDLPGSRPGTFAVLHMHIRTQVDVTR
jgi:hypothetical protein